MSPPLLLRQFALRPQFSVEVWLTSCIINSPPPLVVSSKVGTRTQTLRRCVIVPSNRTLALNFPYFPIGGPVPDQVSGSDQASSNKWGGMDAGENMLYPSQTVHGALNVHIVSSALDSCSPSSCHRPPPSSSSLAFLTSAPRSLRPSFDSVVHSFPPFHSSCPSSSSLLSATVRRSLLLALRRGGNGVVGKDEVGGSDSYHLPTPNGASRLSAAASPHTPLLAVALLPLIGAGCRGFPVWQAAERAACAVRSVAFERDDEDDVAADAADDNYDDEERIVFCVQGEETAAMLIDCLSRSKPSGGPAGAGAPVGGASSDVARPPFLTLAPGGGSHLSLSVKAGVRSPGVSWSFSDSSYSSSSSSSSCPSRLVVRTSSPARDGLANDDIVKQLAKALGVAKTDVVVVEGTSSGQKVVWIDREPKVIQERLAAILRA